MNSLAQLLENEKVSDPQVKMTLLDVDFGTLAKAMVYLPDHLREVFFRNTTYSAKKQLAKLLDSYKKIEEAELIEASDLICERLIMNRSLHSNMDMPELKEDSPIRVETHNKHEIFASLLDISQRVQRDGLQALESTMTRINDSYLENFVIKKGLEYVLAGRDPKTSLALMENLKKVMLKNIEEHLNMILEGIEQIQSGHSTKELVERMKNYL